MSVADLPAVLEIERVSFAGDPPWSEAIFRDELDLVPDQRAYLVAVAASRVIGFAGLVVGVDQGDVATLAVNPADRRRGVARALLEALVAEAVSRRLGEVLLEVRADNRAAVQLYRQAGFDEIARRRRYYADGSDALVMRARLNAAGVERGRV